VSNDALVTPPTPACLPGVTRGVIMDLAQRMGIAVSERALTPGDLYVADEVFLTGTGAEVVPVGEVDGRIIGDECPGPVTIRLTADYRDAVRASS
jgi:branched-chain amino acid aminotransferase